MEQLMFYFTWFGFFSLSLELESIAYVFIYCNLDVGASSCKMCVGIKKLL